MAKKEKKESKIVLERTYNVPLRKSYLNAPNWNRTKKAVKALKEFIARHMKAGEVKIGKYANLELWKHGIKNPPHHVKVLCRKNEQGIVYAELVGAPEEKPLPEEKKGVEKGEEIKVREALGEETKEEKLEEALEGKKEELAEKAKEIEKEEIKELKKEHPKVHHAPHELKGMKQVEKRPTAPMGR